MADSALIAITITAEDSDWLAGFCAGLVSDRLAACANITPEVFSVYRWDGEVEHATEALAVLHTRAELFDAVAARVDTGHPYDTPQLLAVPIVLVSPGYAQWVLDATQTA
ncbi:divalent-cation tolerance protein CutA [Nocardia salmonicida]|uniref:divalent-cation tolerance protein CutA n=1 Tax=Nocardia salmonicida TaxID=53431 RepID=UPI0033F998FE